MADGVETYYRTDPFTGEVAERTVATARDAVEAKYAGYHPKGSGGSTKKQPAKDSSTTSAAPETK
ncbi:MAG: hypothetical protein ABWY93_18905 [Mycobacterium sp.]